MEGEATLLVIVVKIKFILHSLVLIVFQRAKQKYDQGIHKIARKSCLKYFLILQQLLTS